MLVSYAELIELFYRSHDPTQMNGQGPDIGSQYRSAIFYHTPEQKEIAEKVSEEIKEKHPLVKAKGGKLATEIVPAGKWWSAEEYHQKYLDNNPGGYECPTHRLYVDRVAEREHGLTCSYFLETQMVVKCVVNSASVL